ncbi:hypothetical protein TNCV_4301691 [Trichonephila clavipes]|uniref:Uncharacterized protein n=1 Tax=Trichonephila clavipes TaxID=2585209 RepID=A0A8X6RUA1_TRICX|nr:hypothetical protein TNCV_4301691 [Trichonephila clavipes]
MERTLLLSPRLNADSQHTGGGLLGIFYQNIRDDVKYRTSAGLSVGSLGPIYSLEAWGRFIHWKPGGPKRIRKLDKLALKKKNRFSDNKFQSASVKETRRSAPRTRNELKVSDYVRKRDFAKAHKWIISMIFSVT